MFTGSRLLWRRLRTMKLPRLAARLACPRYLFDKSPSTNEGYLHIAGRCFPAWHDLRLAKEYILISWLSSLSLPTFAHRLLDQVCEIRCTFSFLTLGATKVLRFRNAICSSFLSHGMHPYAAEWSYSERSTNPPCNICHYSFWNRWSSSRVGQDEIVVTISFTQGSCFLGLTMLPIPASNGVERTAILTKAIPWAALKFKGFFLVPHGGLDWNYNFQGVKRSVGTDHLLKMTLCNDVEHRAGHSGVNANAANVGKRSAITKAAEIQGITKERESIASRLMSQRNDTSKTVSR